MSKGHGANQRILLSILDDSGHTMKQLISITGKSQQALHRGITRLIEEGLVESAFTLKRDETTYNQKVRVYTLV